MCVHFVAPQIRALETAYGRIAISRTREEFVVQPLPLTSYPLSQLDALDREPQFISDSPKSAPSLSPFARNSPLPTVARSPVALNKLALSDDLDEELEDSSTFTEIQL